MTKQSEFIPLCPVKSYDKQLEDKIIEHEGMKKFAYEDTLGNITIGIGRCLSQSSKRGLSTDEIFLLFRNDLSEAESSLLQYPWYVALDTTRRGVLIEMVFNMGIGNLLQFKLLISALSSKDYKSCAKEMKSSKWATQIGLNRLNDMVYRMLNGSYS